MFEEILPTSNLVLETFKVDITNITSMAVLADKMRYHAARQEVISQNISAADIPHYTRKDINAESFSSYLSSSSNKLQLATTDGTHITSSGAASHKKIIDTKMPVELDMEALEMMKNNQDFGLANQTYKKFIMLFKEAIGTGNR